MYPDTLLFCVLFFVFTKEKKEITSHFKIFEIVFFLKDKRVFVIYYTPTAAYE